MSAAGEKNNKKTNIIVAIAAISTLMMTYSLQSAILSSIQGSFPMATDSQIQLVYSVCSLSTLPTMFGTVKLSQIISKKKCLIIGILLVTVGGLLPVFLHSELWMLYVSSVLIGLGVGFINVSSATLISEHFQGPDKGRVMGIQSALHGVGAAAFSLLGGAIANRMDWKWSFLVYALGIPVLIIFAVLMPEDKPEKALKTEKIPFLTKSLIALIGINFLNSLMSTGFSSNISMFIDVEGMGSVALSGILNAFFMVVSVPVGFALGFYLRKVKRWALLIYAGLSSVGMILIFLAHSLVPVVIGTVLAGISFAGYPPVNMTFICDIVRQENVSRSIALNNALGCFARFISPIVVNFITGLFGGGIRMNFIVCGIGLAVVFALILFFNPVKNSDLE